jgi:tRNA (mo5U34)-methyltransferase
MKNTPLAAQASQFHRHLESLKSRTVLDQGRAWYPWFSLAAFEVLDQFLHSDRDALNGIIGERPVLDAGCGDGDVAFFLESLGARVDAIDHAPTNYNWMLGVRTLKRLLNSGVGVHAVDLDARPNLPSSGYGLTMLLGILYHLKNPFLVLETLARHSRHIFLSTRIAALTPNGKINFGALPMAYLVDEDELNNDGTNFWIFSEAGLKRLVQRAGWKVLHYTTVGTNANAADPVTPEGDVRAYILAESRLATPAGELELERGWHELEHGGWRWTERRFSVRLNLSESLAPATLRFVFDVTDHVLARHSAVTLTARLNDHRLPPATFSTPGEHEYTATVPSLPAGPARIEFELDTTLAPADGEERELGGILVSFIGPPPVTLGA